jgi:glucosamine 6-phosphate synthetase-like amidotransferase/phosphosugar isomerase protein
MCGIFGILGPEADPKWIAQTTTNLFEETEERGKDSSGLAWIAHDDGGQAYVQHIKKPVKGSEFSYDEDLLDILYEQEPSRLIGHCRKLSQGKADNDENNHPLVSDLTGLGLVHNGRVHDYLWRAKNDEGENPYVLGDFKAEVDTEAILRLIDTMLFIPREDDGTIDPETVAATSKEDWSEVRLVSVFKAIDDTIFNLSGKNTCALLDPTDPDKIFVWRVDNPLYIAYVPTQKAVVFASTEQILKKALSHEEVIRLFNFIPVEKKTNTTEYNGMELRDSALVEIEWIGEEGNEFKFNWTMSDPDGADFSIHADSDRSVETSKDSKNVIVH